MLYTHTHTPCSYKQNKSEVWKESYSLKSEKGSITIFVLTTMLVVLGVIFINFFTLMNKNNAQLAEIEKIQEEYNKTADMGTMEELYNSLITGLSTGEGVIEVLEGEKVQLPEPEITGEVGEITYSTTSSAITVDSKTGEVTGVDGGAEKEEATVVAKESNGGASCEYKIEVKVWYGEGTEESPYQISNKRDLEKLDEKVEKVASKGEEYRYTGKKFKQTTNIDLENGSIMIGQEGNGEETIGFNGEYDGNNKEINNLNIEENRKSVALFVTNGEEGIVKNLTVGGKVKISGTGTELWNQSGIVSTNFGKIDNCTNNVEVESDSNGIGGIAGVNNETGEITNCTNNAKILSRGGNVAGIVNNNKGLVENCTNNAEVINEGDNTVGGITGDNWTKTGVVRNCVNNGHIISRGSEKGSNVGGVVGSNNNGGTVESCFNYGKIDTPTRKGVGGIVGWAYTNTTENLETVIQKCANYGFVYGKSMVGGIVGHAGDGNIIVKLCANYGNVLGTGTSIGYDGTGDFDFGGVVGLLSNNSILEDSYNKDAAVRGNTHAGGIVGGSFGIIRNCYNTGNVTSYNKQENDLNLGGVVGYCVESGKIYNSYTQTGKDDKIIGYDVGEKTNVSFKEYSEMISDSFVNTLGTANWKKGGTTPILTWQEDEEYTREIEEGVYMLYTALSPTNKVMDIANGETVNGTNVQLYDMNYSQAQKFRISKTGKAGTYSIINVNSGKSLDVQNGSTADGANLQIYEPNGTTSQIWKIIDYKNGYYAIQSLLGSYIHVKDGQTANGTNIHMWNSADTTNKNCQWMLKKAIE